MTRLQFTIVCSCGMISWASFSWVTGGLDLSNFVGFGFPVAISWALWEAYERNFWKHSFFRRWLNDTPNLIGCWSGTLHSSYVPKGQTKPVEPIKCYVLIAQTATKIDMRLFTESSQSQTLSGNLRRIGLIGHEVIVNYENKPLAVQRQGSPLHYGTLKVRVNSLFPDCIEGEYWTSRNTSGDLVLSERQNYRFSTYEEASRLFSS